MGMKNAAVYIKLSNPEKYKVENIITQLFGEFEKTSDQRTEGFEFRKPNYVLVSYHQNGIILRNAQFIAEIIVNRKQELINRIYEFFDRPEVILGYMNYSSGGSFGFSYIENGKIIRFRYSLSTDEVTHDFGHPLEEELNIINGRIFYVVDENNEREYLYNTVDDPEKSNSYYFYNSHLTDEVMKAKIGFGLEPATFETKDIYVTLKNQSVEIPKKTKKDTKKNFFERLFGG